ncbi:GlxA family transcriptional regulator [Variovorax sp. GT1P44]|uniref:GlxA family transcriptional regulator n=1 Tax=Variovorax sp. GT1P44 TaxID=3443742 RepID=UPI003F45E24C
MKRQIDDMNAGASAPVRVAILLPDRPWAGSVLLVRDLLQAAGTLVARNDDIAANALFDVRLVARSKARVISLGGLPLTPDLTLGRAGDFRVVVVPAQFAPAAETTEDDAAYGDWLRRQHAAGALLVSFGGALLLAKSGLLDGREATGLLSERSIIQRRFPEVRYQSTRRIVAAADIVTVCGIGPTVDACAHLIERFFGVQRARRFLRHTSTEVLPADNKLALWSAPYKGHGDPQVLAVQEILEREMDPVPSLAALAQHAGLSERSLSRRFVAAVGFNLRQYVANLRLERADHLLTTSRLPLAHVARECGYASASALSRAFAAARGKAPRRHRLEHAVGQRRPVRP